MGKVVLTGKGRRWFLGGHPWIYTDDLAGGEGEPGELLPIEDPNGRTVGWGMFSANSKISVRTVVRNQEQPNRAFWQERIQRAVGHRQRLGYLEPQGACRLLSGDAEGVPGLIVDWYSGVLVLQCGTQSADRMRDFLVDLILEAMPFAPRAILDRSDVQVRRLEGLESRVEWLSGSIEKPVVVKEDGLAYIVDPREGHKTGHYLDQRENRRAAAKLVQRTIKYNGGSGARVLDAFCYDGLFGIRAALAGATDVLCIDQSQGALDRVLENADRNGVSDKIRVEKQNAMRYLRALASPRAEEGEEPAESQAESFDMVVIDPPAFARNRREVEGAMRGYRELNLRGMKLTRPGGYLVSASCSYAVGADDFFDTIKAAARDAERDVYVESIRGASADHPVHVNLPESSYLKSAFLRVE